MKLFRRCAVTLGILSLTFLNLSPTFAEAGRDPEISVLTYRSEAAEKDFKALLEKIRALSETTRASDPETTGKLQKALDTAQQQDMADALREITQLLAGEKVGEAGARQKEIVQQMQTLLQMLTASRQLETLERTRTDAEKALRAMLERQKKFSAETLDLDKSVAEARSAGREPARADALAAQDIAADESELACKASDLADLVQRDGSTLVFPNVLKEIYSDLKSVEAYLAKTETSKLTQVLQAGIERNLQNLIEALQDERQTRTQNLAVHNPAAPSGTAPPLISPVVELKLLRAIQMELSERTRGVDIARGQGALSEPQQMELAKITERQKSTADFAEVLKQKIAKP